MNSRGILYIVGTPIGNLKDITFRAVEILNAVDIIACEDTRHSLKLLNHYNIKKPLISYYKEKEKAGSEYILGKLEAGNNIALIADAGMPCISDPGSLLVLKARENNIKVEVVPGPSAVISAYVLSGDLNNGFTFIGFLPSKNKDRDCILEKFKNSIKPVILYSAPHDIKKDLQKIQEKMGDRKILLVKEITKLHECVIEGRISEILEAEQEYKGEFVVIVKPIEEKIDQNIDPEKMLKELLESGMEKKTAIKQVSKMTGLIKDDIYKIFLKIQK